MNKTIKLFFNTEPIVDVKSGVELYEGIRLLGAVQFLIDEKWSLPVRGVVDTGAPISLIPHKIWTKCITKVIGEAELRGVIPKKECVLTVNVGTIQLRLVDTMNTTDTLEIKSYLAPIDNVPLIIGFEDLLSEFDVFFSYTSQNAFIKAGK